MRGGETRAGSGFVGLLVACSGAESGARISTEMDVGASISVEGMRTKIVKIAPWKISATNTQPSHVRHMVAVDLATRFSVLDGGAKGGMRGADPRARLVVKAGARSVPRLGSLRSSAGGGGAVSLFDGEPVRQGQQLHRR